MPFSPEHFMRDDVHPIEWAKLRENSMSRFTSAIEGRRKEAEQTRQFEEEQARLRDQQEQAQLKYQSGLTLQKEQLEFDKQKQDFEREKYDAKLQIDQEAVEREGVKTLLKAWTDSDEVKEFNAAAQMISETHDIQITPKGVVPDWAQPAPMMGPGAPEEPGMAPPPGTPPEAPAQAGPPAPGVVLNENGVPVPEAPPSAAPPGSEAPPAGDVLSAPGVVGPPVNKIIASGAAAVAGAAGVDKLGAPPPQVDDDPSEPEGAQTAEDAVNADKENPVVEPDQQMPARDASELSRRLENQKPITQVEANDRVSTDTQVKASYDKRLQTLQAMGLTPIQLAIAANMAAKAHDLPPVPIPTPAPDPNVPPDQQGNGAFDVELPKEVADIASAPPELQPSIVRDGRLNGGFDFWSRRRGVKLGSLDWNEVQESRLRKRMKDWTPVIDIADNPRDKERLTSMVELWARSKDPKAFDVVMQYIGKLYGKEAAVAQGGRRDADAARRDAAEARSAVKDMTSEMSRIKGELFKNEGLDEMKKTIQATDRTLEALRTNPSSTNQRKVMADFLAEMYGRRATDQDANRGLRDNLWTDVVEFKNYLLGKGELSPKRMKKMQEIIVELNQAEKNKRGKMAEYLHEQVMNSLTIQTTDSSLAKSMAQQAVIEAFPDLPHDVVVHAIGSSMRRRRERLTGRIEGEPAPGAPEEEEVIPYDEITPDDL